MKKLWQFPWGLVWLLTLALMPEPAFAVDNTLLITPCAAGCITTKSKDIGAGVQAPQPVLSDSSGNVLGMPTAGADAVSNTVLGLQGYNYPFWFNGVTWDRARGDATNGAFVNIKSSVALTANQGTANATPWNDNVAQLGGFAINLGAGAIGTGTQRITQASDSPEIAVLGVTGAAAGCGTANTVWQCLFQIDNDIKSGVGSTGSAVPSTALYPGLRGQNAEQAAVTNGQLVGQASDLTGKAIFLPYANPENGLNGQITAAMTGTSSTAVTGMGAQGAGVRNYVTQCTFSNSHATVGTIILLQDGSGGATIWQAPAAPAFGGAVVQFPTPIKTTANTGLFAQNVTTGSNTFLSCTGYKGI